MFFSERQDSLGGRRWRGSHYCWEAAGRHLHDHLTPSKLWSQSFCRRKCFFFFFFFFSLTPTLRLLITPLWVQSACVADLKKKKKKKRRRKRERRRSFLSVICMIYVRRGARGWISRICHLIWRKSLWRIFIWFLVTFCGRDGAKE